MALTDLYNMADNRLTCHGEEQLGSRMGMGSESAPETGDRNDRPKFSCIDLCYLPLYSMVPLMPEGQIRAYGTF